MAAGRVTASPGSDPRLTIRVQSVGHAFRNTAISLSRLRQLWLTTRTSYWFVPGLMVLAGIVLAIVALPLDLLLGDTGEVVPWFGSMGADAARAILTTIASTMVTVAGVVFSITIVVLQLASSQFGPRLLRNFMTDLGNQIVFGTFTATFVYCLVMLISVRGDPHGFVPVVGIWIGLMLALASIGVLIYFIHHIAQGIRVERVVQNVAADLEQALDRLFLEAIGHDPPASDAKRQIPADLESRGRPVCTVLSGYIQAIDAALLMEIARDRDLLLVLEHRPGDFISERMRLLYAYPAERVADEVAAGLRECFAVGIDRTPPQDPGFVSQQLTQIALRALSPGINDPYTAVECINRLTQGFRRAASRHRPSPYRSDAARRLRVVAPPDRLLPLVLGAFAPIARAADDNGEIVRRVLDAVALIIPETRHADDLDGLLQFARTVRQESGDRLTRPSDRAIVEQAYAALVDRTGAAASAMANPKAKYN
jgi:uncharacterized membrane protein